MSYYTISIFITILFTTLLAFYYLYKSRDLNLGILISVSTGSLILGLTFYPVYRLLLTILQGTFNMDNRLEAAASVALALVSFLIIILSISFISSFCLPLKLCTIDCCIAIDRLMGKMRKSTKADYLPDNEAGTDTKEKKPVDTTQIIDTMGIEKSGIDHENAAILDSIEKNYEENSLEAYIDENQRSEEASIYKVDASVYSKREPAESYEEKACIQETAYVESEHAESIPEDVCSEETAYVEPEHAESINEDAYFEESAGCEPETVELMSANSSLEETADCETGFSEPANEAELLVLRAFDCKVKGQREQAIQHYTKALEHSSLQGDMVYWIVLDICTLYKQLGLNELACSILNGIAERFGDVISPAIRKEIFNNLK